MMTLLTRKILANQVHLALCLVVVFTSSKPAFDRVTLNCPREHEITFNSLLAYL